MAYTFNGLHNLIKGNVKNCTFYLMNGQQVARYNSNSVKNPRTHIQQLNRANIKPLIDYYRQIKPVLYLALNDRPEKQSAYHNYLSINLNKSIKKGRFNPEKFKITNSSFKSTKFEINRQINNQDNFKITWSNDSNKQKLGSDKLLCVYYDFLSNSFQYSITSKSRSDLAASVSFELSSIKPYVLIYIFFVRSDYSKSSKLSILEYI